MKIFLLLSLFGSFAFASKYNYKTYWSDSGYVKTDKKSSFKILLKKSPIMAGVPIAVMTMTRNNQEKKDTVVNLYKTSVGKDCNWKQDNIDGLEIHECASLKTGSFFRLAYNNKTQEFSTGSLALRYLLPTYVELHLLQAENLTAATPRKTKKTAWLMELLMQKAYAIELSANASNFIGNVGSSFFGSTNTSINNVAGAGNNLAGAGNNLAGAGNNLANAGNNIAGSIDNAGNKLDSTVKDTFNSKNVAKLSAVAGATFGLTSSLGSMAANFLVNGSYTMLRTLFYEAKGEFTPEEKKMRLERFEKSLKTFKDLEPSLNEMASKLALASAELTIASGVGQEEFLAKIDQDIETARLSRMEASTECQECFENEKALKIKQLEDFKKVVIAAGGSVAGKPKSQVCENIEALYKNWVNSEYALLNSRRLIMQDLRLFNGTIIDGIQTNTAFQENRKQNNSCLDTAESKLNKVKRELDGKNCEDGDLSTLLCQKYEAYKGMVESCKDMESQKSTERDETELVTATSNVSKVLAQFSRELGSLSCDGKTPNCSKGKLDRVRSDMKDIFANAGKQCPQFFFAKQSAPKAPVAQAAKVENAPAAVSPEGANSVFSSIKTFFTNPKPAHTKAAEDVVGWQN